MAQVQGDCDPKFNKVREQFQQFLESGEELGASICVNIDGKDVVDIWGGYMDAAKTRLWEKDTLTVVWSMTKCVTNMAALILVDRGLLDPSAKVSKYWPEFAANGKENVEVRHFLSHSSGVPAWEPPITRVEMYDIPKATEKLAQQAPWWTPGTASGYHLVTQGHLVGELVRRITGKSLKQFIEEEITGPLGVDFYIGAPESVWDRTADIVPPPPMEVPPGVSADSVAVRAIQGSSMDANIAMTPEFRKAELGASNGFGNARSVARTMSTISLGGEVDGKRLLSQKAIDRIFETQTSGIDLVLGTHIKWGLGFGLANKDSARAWIPETSKVAYWGGWGGSVIVMDLDKRMTICYAMNRMAAGTIGNARSEAYGKAIYEALGN